MPGKFQQAWIIFNRINQIYVPARDANMRIEKIKLNNSLRFLYTDYYFFV